MEADEAGGACDENFSHVSMRSLSGRGLRVDFVLQYLDLRPKRFVFGSLPGQESAGQGSFCGEALGREDIGIAALVRVGREVAELHEALFDKGFQAVIYKAEANAESFGQLPLRKLRVAFKLPHDTKADIVVYLPGHEADAPRLPHWRSQYESERKGSFIRERLVDSEGEEKAPCVIFLKFRLFSVLADAPSGARRSSSFWSLANSHAPSRQHT